MNSGKSQEMKTELLYKDETKTFSFFLMQINKDNTVLYCIIFAVEVIHYNKCNMKGI